MTAPSSATLVLAPCSNDSTIARFSAARPICHQPSETNAATSKEVATTAQACGANLRLPMLRLIYNRRP